MSQTPRTDAAVIFYNYRKFVAFNALVQLETELTAALAANEALVKDVYSRSVIAGAWSVTCAAVEADRDQLRSQLDALTQDREQFIVYCQSLQLATGQVGPIQVAKSHIERLSGELKTTERHLTIAREERTAAQNDAAALRGQLEASQAECERLRKDKERLDWLCANSLSYWKTEAVALVVTEYDGGGNLKEFCRVAIDAAMQPAIGENSPLDEQTKPA